MRIEHFMNLRTKKNNYYLRIRRMLRKKKVADLQID